MAGENGLIELGQFGLAVFAAIGLFAAGAITRRGTAGLVAFG